MNGSCRDADGEVLMPELPNVEAIRRYLVAQGLVGCTVTGVELLWPGGIRIPSEAEFRSGIVCRPITAVRRRGKYLLMPLGGSPSRTLVLHLGMTGSLLVHRSDRVRPDHIRNVLLLDGGRELCFVDTRKLGSIWLVGDEATVLGGLGPEPLSVTFTKKVLAESLWRRKVPVKALLCDQALVAGIGNIYADEVLFSAGVHPLKIGHRMSRRQVDRLHSAIVTRLAEATELLVRRASSVGPPSESEGGDEALLVPRAKGAPCSRCETPVARAVIRGRSAYYCPRCQRK